MLIIDGCFQGRGRLICGYLLLLAVSLVLSGCWDRVEIQDRGIVLMMAIDVAEAPNSASRPEAQLEWFVQGADRPRPFRLSLQVLKYAVKGKPTVDPSKTYVLSSTGQAIFETVRDMLGQSSKALWFEHVQAVVISEEAVKRGGLSRLLDFWRRDAEMRWRFLVFITPGEARPILDFVPPSGEPGGIYLTSVARRQLKDSQLVTARTDLLATGEALDAKGDVILPCLELSGKSLKIKNAAVFKKDRFAGYIDEYAVMGARYIRGVEKDVAIVAPDPDHPGEFILFELMRHDTKLTPRVEGDNIYFTLDIAMRGNIDEVSSSKRYDTTDPEVLHRVQQLVAEEVKRNVLYAHQKLQMLGTDVIPLGQLIKAQEPKTWEKIKDRWDEIYPTVPLVVSVSVAIITVGEHK